MHSSRNYGYHGLPYAKIQVRWTYTSMHACLPGCLPACMHRCIRTLVHADLHTYKPADRQIYDMGDAVLYPFVPIQNDKST